MIVILKTLHLAIIGMMLISTIMLSNAIAVTYHGPPPTLTSSENQTIIDTALSIPGLQNWSHSWRYVLMGFGSNNKLSTPYFMWQYASVVLKAPSASAPIPCNNDWWATIVIDMTTMRVVSATYPTMESHSCQVTTGGGPESIDSESSNNTTNVESPLQQFKAGIVASKVTCNQGFQLILKTEDGSPACVKPTTAQILIERGWTKAIANLQTLRLPPAINPNETVDSSNLPFIPPSLPPPIFPNGTSHVNKTALAYAKIPNWDKKFDCEKYAGSSIQIIAKISNALKFSGMITDPRGLIHDVTPVTLNTTQMEIQFSASISDPDGNYVTAFNVVNGSNTSNIDFYCEGSMVENKTFPGLHVVTP